VTTRDLKKRQSNPDQLQLPLLQDTTWVQATLPDLRHHQYIALDTETRDDGLSKKIGPGWAYRGLGHIAGLSFAAKGGHSGYVSIRHPDSPAEPIENVLRWIADHEKAGVQFVFHNSAYDAGWIGTEGHEIKAEYHDTMFQAVILDENAPTYKLDAVSKRLGFPGKDETGLREAALVLGVDAKSEMWKMPARYVGTYAATDAVRTLEIFETQSALIRAEGLEEAYDLERRLVRLWNAMRRRGIRVNPGRVEASMRTLRQKRDQALAELGTMLERSVGMDDLRSPASLEMIHDRLKIDYPRTPKTGRGSFSTDWMSAHPHPVPRSIDRIKNLDASAEKFLGQYILSNIHLGRIHAEVHPLRDDDGGTVSYRVSYSNPPLQQMPGRDEEMKNAIRSAFEPEEGEAWLAADYSQQEPRLTVHYAAKLGVRGADKALAYYRDDPGADYHSMVAEMYGQPRKVAKILNLGLAYGMGTAKLALSLGVSMEEGKRLLDLYHERVPYVHLLAEESERVADQRGFIKLLDNRRCRFDRWEPRWRGDDPYSEPLTLEAAKKRWAGRNLRRAWTRKALNRLIQGGSAVQTKKAMLLCYELGHLPLLQMHDELDFSVSSRRQVEEIGEAMVNCVQLLVPTKVDLELGRDWGDAKHSVDEFFPLAA
jgi:DNA polymerase I-like protein with 3'-5' exonuclease and polymerase domains